MLTDQAQALRTLANRSSAPRRTKRAQVVAITSGKGGVGKSNIAVNLAIRLSMMGRRVLLMDADLGTANADVLCNLNPRGDLAHVVAGRQTLAQAIVDAPGGFGLIPGASGLAGMAALGEYERSRLMQDLNQLEAQHDLILIDTGAGVSPNVLSFAVGADQLLVLTTPEPTAVTDAYAVIKTVVRQRANAQVRILVNMVKDADQGRGVYKRIDAVCRKFLGLPTRYAGHVVHDPRVSAAVCRRRPFVLDSPHCEASTCISQLAHRMDRHGIEPPNGGLLRRLTTWMTR